MEHKRSEFWQIKISDLFFCEKDFKEHDSMKALKLQNMVATFGQLLPVLVTPDVDGKYKIISGRKLTKALIENGYSEIHCSVVYENPLLAAICVNELHFDTNYIELANELLKSNILERNQACLPFSEDEIEKIKSIATFDWTSLVKVNNPNQTNLFNG